MFCSRSFGDVPPEFGGVIPDATDNLPGLGTSQGKSESRDVSPVVRSGWVLVPQ